MRISLLIYCIFTFICAGDFIYAQTVYYSQGSDAPNIVTNWNTNRGGGGSSPTNFTSNNVTYVIQNGHSMTTSNPWSISGTNTKLQIEDGGTLTVNHTITLASSTTFQIDNGGTFIQNVALAMSSTILQGTESFDSNSNYEIRVNPTGTTAPSGGYGNLTINVSSATSNFGWGGNITSVKGDFKILATGGGTYRHALVASAGNINLNVNGNFIVSGGNFWFSSGSSTVNMTVDGNLIISGGTLDLANSTGAGTLNIGGDFQLSSGTLKSNSATSTINFTGTNCSFTQSGGTLTSTNINWTIKDNASLVLNNELPVASSRTLTVGQGSNGVLDCGTNQVSGAGTIVTGSNSTLKTAHTNGLNGNLTVTNKNLNNATNYVFSGTSDQVTGSLIANAKNITIENTSGIVSLSNNIAISGTLTIPSGAKLDAGSYTLSGTGNIDLQSGGKFITSHASGLNGNNTTTGGSSSYSTSANYEFNRSGTQVTGSFLPNTVNNLTVSGTSQLSVTNPGLLTVSNNLILNAGTTFEVASNQSLTVSGTLSNSGTLTLKSDATGTGSLIHSTSGVNATVERYVAGGWSAADAGWHLISSPVASQAISAFETSGSGNGYDLYGWDEANKLWMNYKDAGFSTWNGSGNFVVGRGYLISYEQTQTGKSFSGNLNVSDVSLSNLSYTPAQGNGWHLLGNPFASALEWNNNGDWNLSNVAGTAKIWHSTNKSYSDISAGGIIPQSQGFFVQVTNATNSLTIPASARTHSSQAWYKNSDVPQLKLIARPADGSSAQETLIRIEPEATTGNDPYWDSRFLAGYAPQLYSLADGVKLSTNALPSISEAMEIPLGFEKNQHNNFTLELSDNSLSAVVLLKDLKTGITHNLTQQPVYTFTSAEGDDPLRFKLAFASVGLEPAQQDLVPYAWYAFGMLHFRNVETGSWVEVYAANGQRVMREQFKGDAISLKVAPGVYMVKIAEAKQQNVQKIVIY
ncbi:MAG: hypothetical protein PWP35_306 [Bacteroidales bacterium]|nr:hypothetical protein [Bacteroidales bacterium]